MAELWEQALAAEGAPTQVVSTEKAEEMAASAVNVFTKDGKAYLIDPTGRQAIVPEETTPDLLAKGYKPQDERAVLEGEWEGASGLETFMLHGINEFFPGSAGSGFLPEIARRSEREHPTAATAGKISGAVGGMLTPTAPLGVATRGAGLVGRAVGRGVAGLPQRLAGGKVGLELAKQMPGVAGRGAARVAAKAAPAAEKIAQWGTQGAIEGAALGAGQAAARGAIHPEQTVNEALSSVVSGALWGGAGGAVLGAAGAGISAVSAKRAAKAAATRTAALNKTLNEAIAPIVAKRDLVRADLAKFWTPTNAVGLSMRGWARPSLLDNAESLILKADDIEQLTASMFRTQRNQADSWISKATELMARRKEVGQTAARKAQEITRKADLQAKYLEHQPAGRGYQSVSQKMRTEAGEVIAAGKAEAEALSPTISFLEREAKATTDTIRKEQLKLVKDLRSEAESIRKAVDSAKTSSGVPVSKLEETARELQLQMGAARDKAIASFNQTYAPERGRMSILGSWVARNAVARAAGGMVVGGPYGALAGALIGQKPVDIAARITAAVGKKAAKGARAVGRQAATKATAKAVAIRGLSAPAERLHGAVLEANPAQLEEAARLSAEHTALAYGLPPALTEQGVARGRRELEFLKAKAEEMK
jgi:hypothetical protein